MTETHDIVAVGNAIVDVIAEADDAFLAAEGLTKGSMALIDADRAVELYGRMKSAREISGGSAPNTLAGAAMMGARCALIAQVADDQLGEVFTHDIRAAGVAFDVTPLDSDADDAPPTARSFILVTPDAERTMNTFLGASVHLPKSAVDDRLIAGARILYLEGYLWDADEPKAAMAHAIECARGGGGKVAFSLSDPFCVERHRDDFRRLIAEGKIDILFANEDELLSLVEGDDFNAAMEQVGAEVETLVVTRGAAGAVARRGGKRVAVDAEPVERVVDTTGAGDLFAAGVMTGLVADKNLETCLTMGAVAAAEVISHYGARPEGDLKALVAARLG